ncbi:MAG: TetR/AcrR family transcriptional regulator [Ruminobacter sp.]|uniref:TetR/AcrR family transcriptional regulator, mexCD-oprJ operon repressor n=1 Tax=Ruminobacter amylophilus TaxID=867 RepID=A0A662ZDV3_9GAMM|nr:MULTISPECIES: TetR/AcrR family transcriptional regulator [Ruminobacter]MBQ3775557.1 TetR/AcrR family transcriptional regulator [Ruminobacter sp.]SFO97059.1 TetR/AcrR family transcriptional regulator, mexCD-oprJ operon repressor [Ruminobacter amylophilus]
MAFDREELLEKLARAMLPNPGITMNELASSTGISKASLHRIYSTREHLQKIILEKIMWVFDEVRKITGRNSDDFGQQLQELIKFHCDNSTYVLFLGRDDFFEMFGDDRFDSYYDELEQFFREGQKRGYITLDLDAGTVADVFISMVTGILESSLWGHISTRNMEKIILRALLGGIKNNS